MNTPNTSGRKSHVLGPVLPKGRPGTPSRNTVLLVALTLAASVLLLGASTASGTAAGADVLYTLDADFTRGTSTDVNHAAPNGDQLQLDHSPGGTVRVVWVASVGTCRISKVDADTGAILGEYATYHACPYYYDFAEPEGRTAVARDGSLWYWGLFQDILHIGLVEAGQCVDFNGNGRIDTSSGAGELVSADECVVHTISGLSPYRPWRVMVVDAQNKLWVGEGPGFVRRDASTGAVEASSGPMPGPCNGWNGAVDRNGVLWTADWAEWGRNTGHILRWDPNAPDGPTNPRCIPVPINPDGITTDRDGWVWSSELYGAGAVKVSPDGTTVQGPFPSGAAADDGTLGLASDATGDTWIATSWGTVTHLDSSGGMVGSVSVPTGTVGAVDVDAAGRVWVLGSGGVSRVDPALGPLGCGGTGCGDGTHVGAVDLVVPIAVYGWAMHGDIAGSATFAAGTPKQQGSWSIVQDGGAADMRWGPVRWNTEVQGSVPVGTSLLVERRAANTEAGLANEIWFPLTNGGEWSGTWGGSSRCGSASARALRVRARCSPTSAFSRRSRTGRRTRSTTR